MYNKALPGSILPLVKRTALIKQTYFKTARPHSTVKIKRGRVAGQRRIRKPSEQNHRL